MHTEWARMHRSLSEDAALAHRLRSKAKSWRSRLSGKDRDLLGYVVRAVDDVAARCDELAQRLNELAISLDDLARTASENVTRLRAEVETVSRAEPESSRSPLA
jgi:DNA repair exonuclease SbcCD ATPase subunit